MEWVDAPELGTMKTERLSLIAVGAVATVVPSLATGIVDWHQLFEYLSTAREPCRPRRA